MNSKNKLGLSDFYSKMSKLRDSNSSMKAFLKSTERLRNVESPLSIVGSNKCSPQRGSIDRLIEKDKPKLPSLKEYWNNTRDISYLKDNRTSSSGSPLFLPTDINELFKLYNTQPYNNQNAFENMLDSKPETIEKFLTTHPSSRHDIENIRKWFVSMKFKYSSKEDLEDYFEKAFLIHRMCLREIIRHETVSCFERGSLLREVFCSLNELYLEKEQFSIVDIARKHESIRRELDKINQEKFEIQNKLEQNTIDLNRKINELILEINMKNAAELELKREYEILETKYLNFQEISSEKKQAFGIVLKVLEANNIRIDPQITNFINSEDSKPKEWSFPHPSDSILTKARFEEYTQTNIETLSQETQTEIIYKNIKLKKRSRSLEPISALAEYTEAYKTIKNTIIPQQSVSISSRQSLKYPESSLQEIHRQISQEQLSQITEVCEEDFSENNNVHNYQFFDEFSDEEIRQFVPRDVNFESWRAGFLTGLEKGKIIAAEELDLMPEEPVSPVVKRSKSRKIHRSTTQYKNPERRVTTPIEAIHKQKKTTKFNEFNWNKRRKVQLNYSEKIQSGVFQLISGKSIDWLKKKGTMSVRMVNKYIANIYAGCFGKEDLLLHEIAYQDFSKKFGMKSVADKKFIDLIGSLYRRPTGKRKMFLKFFGGGNTKQYSSSSFSLFLKVYQYLQSSKVGIVVNFDEISDKFMLPAVRAIECLKERCEKYMHKRYLNDVHGWVESNISPDLKRINAGGLIPFDPFLETLVRTYEDQQKNAYNGIILLLDALCLSNDTVKRVELEMMVRFFSPEKLLSLKVEGENLSIEQTHEICIEHCLLDYHDIQKYTKFDYEVNSYIRRSIPELSNILMVLNEKYDSTWGVIEPEVFQSRLNCIIESVAIKSKEVIGLGWCIYANEINRINNEFLSS